ncbi:tyrosine-type recombinase/integrase [Nannocystis exedens]|uniref:tyrosine-type recombinase/integrase n=1 Tax=Nannocystis exedens TaxID=54 RepID=UPI00210E4BC9|nr:site-specific integrase [Nannocystis exedens]
MKITIRPYPKNPKRLHVDIMFPHPRTPDRDVRRRLLAPDGMDSAGAKAWGMRQVREILKELGKPAQAEDKEENFDIPAGESPSAHSTHSETLRMFWPQFMEEYVELTLKASSQQSYHSAWQQHIAPVLGDCPLDRLDAAAFSRLKRACRVKGHGAAYRNLICAKVVVALRTAAEWGRIAKEAVPKMPWEKVKRRPKEVYTPVQVEAIVQAARAKSEEAYVLLLLLSRAALRIGEAAGLMWDDIDWDRGTLLIQRNVYRGLLQDSPKGEIGAVPIAPVLMRALHQLRQTAGARSRFVISRLRAGRWTHCNESTLATRVSAIQRAAGVAPKGPHMHRHTALTLAAQAGVPPLALQKLARHSTLETTMRYYIHINNVEMAALAVAALDAPSAGSFGNGLAT